MRARVHVCIVPVRVCRCVLLCARPACVCGGGVCVRARVRTCAYVRIFLLFFLCASRIGMFDFFSVVWIAFLHFSLFLVDISGLG